MTTEAQKLTFTIGGRVCDADTLMASADRRRVVKKDAPASFHRGFSVEGFPPGMLEEHRALALQTVAAWQAMSEQQKADAIKDGRRPPKPWDEAKWLLTTKRKKVRSKPYELLSAAEECQRLAGRSGWINLTIVEVKKDSREHQQRELA